MLLGPITKQRQKLIIKSHNSKITEVTEIEGEPKLTALALKVSNSRLYMIFWKLKATLSIEPRPRD